MLSQLVQHFAGLPQDQRKAVAQQYVNQYQTKNDPQSQEFANVDPNQATPQQLADMTQHAQQNHPDILQNLKSHPLAAAAVAGLAAYGIHQFEDQQQHKH